MWFLSGELKTNELRAPAKPAASGFRTTGVR